MTSSRGSSHLMQCMIGSKLFFYSRFHVLPCTHGNTQNANLLYCSSKQLDLYDETFRPIVEAVLEGYNGRPEKYYVFLFKKSFFFWQVQYLLMGKLVQGKRTQWKVMA